MTYKTICSVQDNRVIVALPPDFSDKKQVTVYIDDQADARSEKLDALKMAATDPLFLADIRQINADFAVEHLGKPGTERRDAFENELKADLSGHATKQARDKRNLK